MACDEYWEQPWRKGIGKAGPLLGYLIAMRESDGDADGDFYAVCADDHVCHDLGISKTTLRRHQEILWANNLMEYGRTARGSGVTKYHLNGGLLVGNAKNRRDR